MKQPVERRLAAILAADMAGYSRLMGADEEGTLERLKGVRRELVDPKIKEHRGRIVKTTGDGLLAEFPSVVDAVRCAVKVQRAMLDRNAETPEHRRITFRIGINLGDVIIDGDDIYGDGVNIAARLEALAEPGGICISRVVRDQIRDKLPYPFEDMGEQIVKNIARPVRAHAMSARTVASTSLVAVPAPLGRARSFEWVVIPTSAFAVFCIAFVIWWAWPKGYAPTGSVQPSAPVSERGATNVTNSPAPRLSFVVLPFENLSRDPEQEYFADGITDDLTTDLSQIPDSFEIARNTAFTYKGKPVDVKQIGRELGVRYIIEGSVRRSANQVQVNVQLIDTETGGHMWADRFETDRRNLAEAQSEIPGRLARTLNVQIIEAANHRIERERAVDPDARDFAMRGWASFNRPFSPATLQDAQQAFERALEIDPRSVDARIGIAITLINIVYPGWSNSVERDETRAEQLLLEALDRDANRADAHGAMGHIRRLQNRLAESRIEWETAIVLDRNDATAFRNLGITLMYLGQPEAAIPQIEKCVRLSPYDHLIPIAYTGLGLCHLLLGQVGNGVEYFRKARSLNPRLYFAHFGAAAALGLKGDLEQARAALAEGMKLRPELNSLAAWRAHRPWETDPEFTALADKTMYLGLRQAGLPDE
jgi:adenylate cyclase